MGILEIISEWATFLGGHQNTAFVDDSENAMAEYLDDMLTVEFIDTNRCNKRERFCNGCLFMTVIYI